MNSKVARIEEPIMCPTIDRIASPVVPLIYDPTEISIVVLDEPESTEIKIEPLDIEEITIIEAHDYVQGQSQIPFDHPKVHTPSRGTETTHELDFATKTGTVQTLDEAKRHGQDQFVESISDADLNSLTHYFLKNWQSDPAIFIDAVYYFITLANGDTAYDKAGKTQICHIKVCI